MDWNVGKGPVTNPACVYWGGLQKSLNIWLIEKGKAKIGTVEDQGYIIRHSLWMKLFLYDKHLGRQYWKL